MGANWLPKDTWLVHGVPGTCSSDPSRVSAPYPQLPHDGSWYISEAESFRALTAIYFLLQHWWQNPISSFGGCEEYLPKYLHLQSRGWCLWRQRVLQCVPGALLHQHVAEGKEGTLPKEPWFHLVHLLTVIRVGNTQWLCKDYFVMSDLELLELFFPPGLRKYVDAVKEDTVNTCRMSEQYWSLTWSPTPFLLWNFLPTVLCLAPFSKMV